MYSFCLSRPIPLAFFRSGDLTVAISCLLGSFSVYPPLLPPPIPAAAFRSGCRTVVILCLRLCLVCAFLLSITTDFARLLWFRRPKRGIVSFGFVQRVSPFYHRRLRLPPFIQAVESWLLCDSSCVCALSIPTKELVIWSYCAFGYHCVVFWVLF